MSPSQTPVHRLDVSVDQAGRLRGGLVEAAVALPSDWASAASMPGTEDARMGALLRKAGRPGTEVDPRAEHTPPGASVLLVDDHEEFRSLFGTALRSRFPDLPVFEAGRGVEGLQMVRDHAPRVVFMDVHLPDGNGLPLTRTICSENPGICVIVCTAHGLPEYQQAAKESGAARFVVKHQLDFDRLFDFVGENLGERKGEEKKGCAANPTAHRAGRRTQMEESDEKGAEPQEPMDRRPKEWTSNRRRYVR